MALFLIQPLTEMSIRKIFLGDKMQPVRKADSLTAIRDLII
jgi:hypothetical protein